MGPSEHQNLSHRDWAIRVKAIAAGPVRAELVGTETLLGGTSSGMLMAGCVIW